MAASICCAVATPNCRFSFCSASALISTTWILAPAVSLPARPPINAVAILPPPIKLIFKLVSMTFCIIPFSKNCSSHPNHSSAFGNRRRHVGRHSHRQGVQCEPLFAQPVEQLVQLPKRHALLFKCVAWF